MKLHTSLLLSALCWPHTICSKEVSFEAWLAI